MIEKLGFDNEKYLEMQSEHIRARIGQFGGKLYLEFGGKLFDDHHASRVLPGFHPDSKIRMLMQLRDQVEIVVAVSAMDIEKSKVRGDLGITYGTDTLRLIDAFRGFGFRVGSVVLTRFSGQPAAEIFQAVSDAAINIDMIVQNVSRLSDVKTDISFTLPMSDGRKGIEALEANKNKIGFEEVLYDDQIGKVSLIGAGMRSHPGITAKFFAALASAGVNIEMISTSEIRISVVTHADKLNDAVRAVHAAFDLDGEAEATVYGGTGR